MTYVYTPAPTAYRVETMPIRLYFRKDEFLKFTEKFRDKIILKILVKKKGIFSSTNIYVAFCKDFIAICKTNEQLPIEIDLEAYNVKGIT